MQLTWDIEEINEMNQLIAEHSRQQQQLAKDGQDIMNSVTDGTVIVAEKSASLTVNNEELKHVQQELNSYLARFTYWQYQQVKINIVSLLTNYWLFTDYVKHWRYTDYSGQ